METLIKSVTFIFLHIILAGNVFASVGLKEEKSNPDITLHKFSAGQWQVTYTSQRPMKRLVFVRNPDNSRTERWQSVDAEFEISADELGEYIARLDGKPFSDGGTLVYSGRFFACRDSCDNSENKWSVTIVPPKDEHIVGLGALHTSQISWDDSDSGQNIYVGKQIPNEEASFISVIDEQLPDMLKDALDMQLPKMMAIRYLGSQNIHGFMKVVLNGLRIKH